MSNFNDHLSAQADNVQTGDIALDISFPYVAATSIPLLTSIIPMSNILNNDSHGTVTKVVLISLMAVMFAGYCIMLSFAFRRFPLTLKSDGLAIRKKHYPAGDVASIILTDKNKFVTVKFKSRRMHVHGRLANYEESRRVICGWAAARGIGVDIK